MIAEFIQAAFVVALVVVVPVLSYQTTRNPEILLIPRVQLYISAAVSQWILAAAGMAAAVLSPLSSSALGLYAAALPAMLMWISILSVGSLAALGAVVWLERLGWCMPEPEIVRALIPQTRREKIWAVLLIAPTAALCEEFLYRGLLQAELTLWFRSTLWATVVSSVVFGLAHAYQGVSGMARAALLGALLAVPVVRLGTLFPSMLSHFIIDAVALVWLGQHLSGRNPAGSE